MSRLERMRRNLARDRRDGWIAGICAGLARAINVNVAFVRVAWVVLTVFSWKVAVAAYVVAWILMPVRDDTPGDLDP